MATDSNINKFTAADIEKYHQGLLSPGQKHEMEKAALEDPLLADALDGYADAAVNMENDLAELKARLLKKTEETKVIPFTASRSSSFGWWKVAALLVLIAGAGTLVYQLSSTKKSSTIAEANRKTSSSADTTQQLPAPAIPHTDIVTRNDSSPALVDKTIQPQPDRLLADDEPLGWSKDKAPDTDEKVKPSSIQGAGTPAINSTAAASSGKKSAPSPIPGSAVKQDQDKALARESQVENDALAEVQVSREENESRKRQVQKATANNRAYYTTSNVFRGRVTDASNNALPFANITNTRDNIGTYSDAQGNFILTSPDSILDVQVKSIGFENFVTQLQNQAVANQVRLQEDRSLTAEVLDTVKRNTNRTRDGNLVLEEPEPVDGWNNYDTYLVNNLHTPEKIKTRQNGSGEVELSFEVTREGQPTNIKVEKSLCDACDKEAIRLVKEGPKWKRKARKGRTTVRIGF